MEIVARKRGFIPVTAGDSLAAAAGVDTLDFIAIAGFTSADAAGGAELPPTPGEDCKKLKSPPPADAAGALTTGAGEALGAAAAAGVDTLAFIAIAGFTSADAAGGAELAPTPGEDCKKLKSPPPAGAAGALTTGAGVALGATAAGVDTLAFIAIAGFTSADAAGAAGGAELAPTPGEDCKKLKNPPPAEAAGAAGAGVTYTNKRIIS